MSRPLRFAVALGIASVACLPPEQGANAILHPWRRPLFAAATPHEDVAFKSGELTLRGWLFRGAAPHRLATRAILFGSSLGAAVALQAAADDPRIVAVMAQSPYADLDSIIDERAPWFATGAEVAAAKRVAEERAHFRIADASPLQVAPRIHVPVLLIHGSNDKETRPVHSERIFKALNEPKRLILVPGAGHNDVLSGEPVWKEIESFLEGLV